MAILDHQQALPTGRTLNMVAASAGGDKIPASDRGGLLVVSASASAATITIATPGNDKYGLPRPDITIPVPANGRVLIAPLPADLADPIDGLVAVSYSSATSLTIAAVSI